MKVRFIVPQIEKKLRLFIAIKPPREAIEELMVIQERVSEKLDHPIRRVLPENMHMTLVFLGDFLSTRLDAIKMALAKIVCPRNALNFDHLELVGRGQRGGFIWIRGQENPTLSQLRSDIHFILGMPEPLLDPFIPHVTLFRLRRLKTYALIRPIIRELRVKPVHFVSQSFSLFQSQEGPDGRHYLELAHYSGNKEGL